MSHRWSNSVADNGILRKHDVNEKKDDILVFGYSCKLFRDDEKALYIDQGKHLIPWMGDDSLKIDRYDCRGNMTQTELNMAEAKVDGVNWLQLLSNEEQRAEKLCDEERYRALYTNEDEEEMYREEELKRLHMMARGSSYGQVQFNYEGDSGEGPTGAKQAEEEEVDKDDEPFIPSPQLDLPEGITIPQSKKLNAIIEKTAMFIANQGTQMEILLKAKQAGNRQFDFLSMECPLHRYYTNMLQSIRERRYQPQQENKPTQQKPEENEHYLHPSLAPVSVESAPSIPSIAYKPSADCAYSMLVNQIKGKDPKQKGDNNSEQTGVDESDIAPPGTELLPLPILKQDENISTFSKMTSEQLRSYASYSFTSFNPDIAKGPVMYGKDSVQEAHVQQPVLTVQKEVPDVLIDSNVSSPRLGSVAKSGPLKLIHYSDSDSASESDSGSSNLSFIPRIPQPPADQQLIIDKMASYVAKNGDTFEQIVKMKGDPRFSFLNVSHEHYPYYKNKRQFYEKVNKKDAVDSNDGSESKVKGPVSFSIKKMKEPEPILPKPALPYESSSNEDGSDNENSRDSSKIKEHKQTNKNDASETVDCYSTHETLKIDSVINKTIEQAILNNKIVPTASAATVTKSMQSSSKPVPIIQPMPFLVKSSTIKTVPSNIAMTVDPKTIYHVQNDVQPMEKHFVIDKIPTQTFQTKKYSERKRSKSKERKSRREKSPRPQHHSADEEDRERRRKKRRHRSPRDMKRRIPENVITLEDDDLLDKANVIDLTEDDRLTYKRDTRDRERTEEVDSDDADRKRKAAAFLSTLKDIPTLATQQQSSLASAMVKTLHSYNRKREEERSRKKKSKKHKRSRSASNSSDSDRDNGGSSNYDQRHRRHSKKSKKTSRDRSKNRSSSRRKTSPREDRETSLRGKSSSSHRKAKATQEQIQTSKPKKHNDKLLTTSLKELVKETRKDLISSEPIKMAVDIFSDKPMKKSRDDDWERNSTSQEGSESGEISTSSSSSDKD